MRRVSSQSTTESNYIKCFGCSLVLWFLCVLLFIARNKEEIEPPSINFHPFTKTKISTKIQSSSASYAASVSPELTTNGWKNIYIHVQSARMPVEEMDYLLEKYWYPRVKNANDEHQTVDNIKDIKFKQKQTKNNKKMIDDKLPVDDEKLRNAPSTTSKSDITYPSDWSSPCFPQKKNDKKCILQHMEYWKKGIAMRNPQKPKITNQYVTFLKDCGGFNNIRFVIASSTVQYITSFHTQARL